MIHYQLPVHAIRTDRGYIEEVLRLAAFFLSIYDKKVDFSWVGDALVSVRGDLKKEHVLEEQGNKTQMIEDVILKLQDGGWGGIWYCKCIYTHVCSMIWDPCL